MAIWRVPGGTARALLLIASSVFAFPASAQDVELLGRIYGTPVPGEYFLRAALPGAFEFSRAFRTPGELNRTLPRLDPRTGVVARDFGPRGAPVAGRFEVPVVLGLFSDSPQMPPIEATAVQSHFFDGPNPTGTISEFYTEASGGRVTLVGSVMDWQRVSLTQAEVVGGSSGLGSASRVAEYIVEVVTQLDSLAMDWGAFDNDGPDGVPNSGDDDGFVDVLAVLHPTSGAECGGADQNIWSHRWSIAPQLGSAFVTRTPSAAGGFIQIDDYTVQPLLACAGGTINQIGVFTHELGHGFGLPDLYGVGAEHAAAGQWDLMGTGSWGCPTVFNPARPCMMGAWTREALGWMTVQRLGFGTNHGVLTLQPASSGGSALRIDTNGDDYYLLENRRRVGFDGQVPDGGGLLVWRVDADQVAIRWPSNLVNSIAAEQGVALMQADGENRLSTPGGGRGDGGDPFPGFSNATAFHAGSIPASVTSQGSATGVTLLDIQEVGMSVRLRVLARFQNISVSASGAPPGVGWVRFDDGPALPSGAQVSSAPFQRHSVEALAGLPISTGLRTAFQGWNDGAERVRSFTTGEADTQLEAGYGGREVELVVALESDQQGVAPGTLMVEPAGADGWFAEGTAVAVSVEPQIGFAFREWTGALEGAANPASLTLDQPATAAALFDVTFQPSGVAPNVALEGGQTHEIVLSVENGSPPFAWTLDSGSLPDGLDLLPDGRIVGVPLEPGSFALGVVVVDAIGLEGRLDFAVTVAPPAIGAAELAKAFTVPIGGSSLGGAQGPTVGQRAFFDAQGNANGVFDLGDFRAFLQVQTTPAAQPVIPRVILPAIRLGGRP